MSVDPQRNQLVIQNNDATNMYVYFGTGTPTTANSLEIIPGESIGFVKAPTSELWVSKA